MEQTHWPGNQGFLTSHAWLVFRGSENILYIWMHFPRESAHNFYGILKGVHDSKTSLKTTVLDLKITKEGNFKTTKLNQKLESFF